MSTIAGWRWYQRLTAPSRPLGARRDWSSESSFARASAAGRPGWGLGSWLDMGLSVSFHGVVIDGDFRR